jgi:GNAT superfamily N-acetyltransferase
MNLKIVEERPERLADYASVPIRYQVTEVFDDAAIEAFACGTLPTTTPLVQPFWKDYDTLPDNHPTDWATRFDVSHWIILAAYLEDRRMGGAIVITGDVQMDSTLLWDIRVAPDARCQGIGRALLNAAEQAARQRGARALRVETQQINAAACRFYFRNEFVLEQINPGAYPMLPDEVQLFWTKPLSSC